MELSQYKGAKRGGSGAQGHNLSRSCRLMLRKDENLTTQQRLVVVQLQAFELWLGEEEGKQGRVAAHEEPVLQSSTISARLLKLRNTFEKLNKKKKPAPPPAPKQQANTTGDDASFLACRSCCRQSRNLQKHTRQLQAALRGACPC